MRPLHERVLALVAGTRNFNGFVNLRSRSWPALLWEAADASLNGMLKFWSNRSIIVRFRLGFAYELRNPSIQLPRNSVHHLFAEDRFVQRGRWRGAFQSGHPA